VIAALAAGLALLAPGPAAADAPAPAVAARSTTVGLGMREWSITVYRPRVRPGTVRFAITNRGEDAHNLQVRGPHGYRSRLSPDAAPGGGRAALTATLKRTGRYTLICEKPGHAALGMKATLRVVRR
jgi:plastocyanin